MSEEPKPKSRYSQVARDRFDKTLHNLRGASSKSDPAMKAVRPDEEVTPLERPPTLDTLGASPTPPGEPSSREMLRAIEERQVRVVDQLIASAETNSALADMLEESIGEDEKTRKELAEARRGYRRMRTAVYALCGVAVASALVVTAVLHGFNATIVAGKTTLDRVDANVKALVTSQSKVSNAVAMKHKADLTLSSDPELEEAALEAVIEAQEATAQAEIEIAESRKEPPPPAAVKALKTAKREKMRLKHPLKAAPGNPLDDDL